MRGLAQRYSPWTAGTNLIAWVAQTLVFPVPLFVYFIVRLLSVAGFLLMTLCSWFATGSRWLFNKLTGHPQDMRNLKRRRIFDSSGTFTIDMVCKLLTGHTAESMLMTWEQSDIFDKAASSIPGIGIRERALWAMLTTVDVYTRLLEYRRLFEKGYPMNLNRVQTRVSGGGDQGEIRRISEVRDTRRTLFETLDNNPNATMGEPASIQRVYNAVVGWPTASRVMETRADALLRAAKTWSTTFEELRVSAHPGDIDPVHLAQLHDILRYWTVQATMLMWWDGLGETEDFLRLGGLQENVMEEAVDRMVGLMEATTQSGVELGVRFLH